MMLAIILLLFSSCRKHYVAVSCAAEKIYNVAPFHSIYAADAVSITIIKSNTYRVVVKGKPEDLGRVSCTVTGGFLDVSYTEPPAGVVECIIEVPVISNLRLAGGSNGQVRGFADQQELFTMVCSGRPKARIDGMPQNAKVEIGGFATAELYGSSQNLQGQVSADGRLYGYGLNAKNVNLQLSQTAKAWVLADSSITAILTGDAKLYYKGDPVLRSFVVMDRASVTHE
jgi:hypothetical protein